MSLTENIKSLRAETGLPILDCKKALIETNNDLIEAKKVLVKYSVLKAQKLLNRDLKVFKIFSYTHNNGAIGILLKLGTETDFVINNEKISKLVSLLFLNITHIITNKKKQKIEISQFLETQDIISTEKKIKEILLETIGVFGENIQILNINFLLS